MKDMRSHFLTNTRLADLSRADFAVIESRLTETRLERNLILAEVDAELDHVYFPMSGMISLVIVMSDGKAIETATIGRDGMFGAMAGFGIYRSPVRAMVQADLDAAVIPASVFRRMVDQSKGLQLLCVNANEALLAQARVTAACNALHHVEARFCRWLVQTHDVTGSDTVLLTQEFLSEMLGVRRTSVTDAATKLQAAGLITYARGVIKIVDLKGLEDRACECVQMLRAQRAI